MSGPFVVVGASLAGGAAVRTLREEGSDAAVVLIGDEELPPYERPPLSKEFLRGEEPEPRLLLPREWYAEHEVELRLGERVAGIDVGSREVELASGERIGYGGLLIATGGRPRELPGAPASDRVCYLRRVGDAERIKAHLGEGRRLAIIGAGFIGSEVAASARALGTEVTVLDPGTVPLERVLGPDMGGLLARIHLDHGVDLRMGAKVAGVEERDDGVVLTVEGAETVEADAVVIGIGMIPNDGLAEEAGLEVGNGVVVDAACRASVPGVWAAGDVARHDHPVFGSVRVEHYDNALKMGAAAARSMLGDDAPFDDPHWFWSDQYDARIEMSGFATSWDEIVVRGSVDERDFAAFYRKEGRVLSVLGMGRGTRDVRRAMPMIREGAVPDREALADPGVDVRELA